MARFLCAAAGVLFLCVTRASAADEVYSGLTSKELEARFTEWVGKKWQPTAVRGYTVGGQTRYDATFSSEGHSAFEMRIEMSGEGFKIHNEDLPKGGYKLLVHSTWKVNGQERHAAIWVKE